MRVLGCLAVGLLLIVVACSSQGVREAESNTSIPGTTVGAPYLGWSPCGDAECASLRVPLDHGDPSLGSLDLAVARRRAAEPEERIGVLLFNPGGPGVSGTEFITSDAFAFFFSPELARHFDVVSWDPRGVSDGTRVDCVDDPERMFALDPTPESSSERAAIEDEIRGFVAGCAERSSDLLPYLSTAATARDMDLLRRALGEEQISYLGVSYGTVLGSVYATEFPDRVRAMVLDSAADISDPTPWRARLTTAERLLTTALERCAADVYCPFHSDGDPFTAFDELMVRLDQDPLIVDGTRIGLGHALHAVWFQLYDGERGWPTLMRTLADAANGDGSRIRESTDALTPWIWEGDPPIRCLDAPRSSWQPTTQVDIDAALTAAPRLGPLLASTSPTVCTHWPVEPDPPPPPTAHGAGPILLIGMTGDPATPIEGARALADRLEDGTLLIVEHNRHGAYRPFSHNTVCVTATVDSYLTKLRVPADGSTCRHGEVLLIPPK